MKSRQRIKVLKLFRVYDHRGKKYNNNESLENLFEEYQSQGIRQMTSHLYESEKAFKRIRGGHRLKIKFI